MVVDLEPAVIVPGKTMILTKSSDESALPSIVAYSKYGYLVKKEHSG